MTAEETVPDMAGKRSQVIGVLSVLWLGALAPTSPNSAMPAPDIQTAVRGRGCVTTIGARERAVRIRLAERRAHSSFSVVKVTLWGRCRVSFVRRRSQSKVPQAQTGTDHRALQLARLDHTWRVAHHPWKRLDFALGFLIQ
ncbi:hypothetical protein ABT173_23105 [Streptomyces sp. NPDC001795]|uniref:hypothetical protein n=1 Tax=unclassified Streptomyces TaxID=2593676 RepID=UPI00332B8EE1